MAVSNNGSSLQSLLHCLDPISLLLSQNPLSESFILERGPRYKAYAELRESRLRLRNSTTPHEPPALIRVLTPPKKQVKFQTITSEPRRKVLNSSSHSALAQSVPDFSAALRKENRRPAMAAIMEMTPPGKGLPKGKPVSNPRGSRSAGPGEKRGGCQAAAARKSYAGIEELKAFSLNAANAINGDGGRVGGGGVRRTVFGFRRFD